MVDRHECRPIAGARTSRWAGRSRSRHRESRRPAWGCAAGGGGPPGPCNCTRFFPLDFHESRAEARRDPGFEKLAHRRTECRPRPAHRSASVERHRAESHRRESNFRRSGAETRRILAELFADTRRSGRWNARTRRGARQHGAERCAKRRGAGSSRGGAIPVSRGRLCGRRARDARRAVTFLVAAGTTLRSRAAARELLPEMVRSPTRNRLVTLARRRARGSVPDGATRPGHPAGGDRAGARIRAAAAVRQAACKCWVSSTGLSRRLSSGQGVPGPGDEGRARRDHEPWTGVPLQGAGMVARYDGDYESALEMHKEAVTRSAESDRQACGPFVTLRLDHARGRRYTEAIAELRAALAIRSA